MDDKSLVEAVRGGRTELFADLVDRHAGAVFRLVRAAIRNDSDVEDIAQDTFLASYRSLDRLRDPRRFRSHLLAIAARKVVDHLRKKKVRSGQVQMTDDPPLPDMSEVRSLVAAVEEVVARLDADARLIFALRHHEGLSCAQIASMLDLSKGTVYTRVSRIHNVIRRAMEVAE